ncbi:MAG: sensor histidine kinase [Oscillatoriales cyanobacterium]|nr:MAG: sensor histidine kinase [Oscillatoriales cyanobacterium]
MRRCNVIDRIVPVAPVVLIRLINLIKSGQPSDQRSGQPSNDHDRIPAAIAPSPVALAVDAERPPAVITLATPDPESIPTVASGAIASNPEAPAAATWQVAYQLARQWGEFHGGFLARTAHELRSPLSSTIGLHQMILHDLCDDPEEERQCVADANRAAQRMVDLLDRLIEVAKMNSGAIVPDVQPIALDLVFDEVEALTCMQAANRNIGLDFEMPPAVDVLADLKRLRQAIALAVDSVLGTLAKAGDNGPVVVSATTADQQVQILLNVTTEAASWSDPIDLLQQAPPAAASLADLQAGVTAVQLSPMMGLWVAQLAIESMHGNLDLLPRPEGVQLRCTLPIAA